MSWQVLILMQPGHCSIPAIGSKTAIVIGFL